MIRPLTIAVGLICRHNAIHALVAPADPSTPRTSALVQFLNRPTSQEALCSQHADVLLLTAEVLTFPRLWCYFATP